MIDNILFGGRDPTGLLCSFPALPQGDRWGFCDVSMSGTPTSHTYNVSSSGEDFERGGGQWNNNSMLSHRRCSSAPMLGNLPSLPSGALAPDLRDHTIPEGRRFEASKQSLQARMHVCCSLSILKNMMNFLFPRGPDELGCGLLLRGFFFVESFATVRCVCEGMQAGIHRWLMWDDSKGAPLSRTLLPSQQPVPQQLIPGSDVRSLVRLQYSVSYRT